MQIWTKFFINSIHRISSYTHLFFSEIKKKKYNKVMLKSGWDAKVESDVLVWCGAHFMSETAKIP